MSEDPLERDIQAQVVKFCHEALPSDVVFFHVPNSGKRMGKKIGWLRQAGVIKGIPDLVIAFRRKVLWIEFKTRKGDVEPHQQVIHDKLSANGFQVEIVRSFERGTAVITEFIKEARRAA